MKNTVSSAMTKKLVTVPWGTPLSEASAIMEEKRIRHLPVVDEDGSILGILSKKDLNVLNSINLGVERVMTSPVLSVKDNLPLRSAIYKLIENKVSSLIVRSDDDVESFGHFLLSN